MALSRFRTVQRTGRPTQTAFECEDCSRRLVFAYDIKRRYGITIAEYAWLLAEQEDQCAICGREEVLFIDHCHSSGDVRGLLCSRCNLGIGHLGDDVERLAAAISYLSG